MTFLTTPSSTERREPSSAPERAERPPTGSRPADPAPAGATGVEVRRLIRLTRLTPAQALEIGAAVLAEAAARDLARTARAVVGDDGRVVLDPAPDGGSTGRPAGPGPAVPSAAAVVADVAAAARLGARRDDPAAARLLGALDQAVRDLPVVGLPAAAERLRAAAAAIDRRAVRAELAALVRAVGGPPGSTTGAGPAGTPSPAPAARARRAAGRQRRTTVRRAGAWLVSIAVLAAVVVIEIVTLRDRVATDIGLLLDAGRSGTTQDAPPEADGLPVPAPAPAAAGSVLGVDLRLLDRCSPGGPCSVRVLVRLVPAPEPQVVSWSFAVVDRCTGAVVPAPGGTVPVPAGGDQATAVGTVALPAVPAVAVLAVLDLPAAAASAPVDVGSCLPGPTG